MGVVTNEPSMEEILSSIKRIIADGSDRAPAKAPRRKSAAAARETGDVEFFEEPGADPDDTELEVLELTERADNAAEDIAMPATQPITPVTAEPASPQAAPAPAESILSDSSAAAARSALSQLSNMLVKPEQGESPTLEAVVREMLRPMLKEWLEAKLPDLVETLVKKEIDRIVGRLG